MLPDRWQRFDEWYNFKSIVPGIRVLATLDESTYTGGVHGENHPIAWYQQLGCGRSWYTALGHTVESFREPLFLQHLLGGLQYAMGNGQGCATLPANVTGFTALLHDHRTVALTWNTGAEEIGDQFIVERSKDQSAFLVVGTKNAIGSPSFYHFQDSPPTNGPYFYRLRLADRQGRFRYSQTLPVTVGGGSRLRLSPNPARGLVHVSTGTGGSEKLTVRIVDSRGHLAYARDHFGPDFQLDLSRLPSGVYLIRVGEETRQVLLAK